jgi:signal transduction histidine kinase/CheY-like chemotaxis protein
LIIREFGMSQSGINASIDPTAATVLGDHWTTLPLNHLPLFLACLALHLALARQRTGSWRRCSVVLPGLMILAMMVLHVATATLGWDPVGDIQVISETITAATALYSASLPLLVDRSSRDDGETATREALRKGTQLASASRIARLCRFSVDLRDQRLDWSRETFPVLGWDEGRQPDTVEATMALIHPDDRERVRRTVDSALVAQRPFEFRARLLRGNGQYAHVHARGDLGRTADGRIEAIHGVVQDVGDLVAALEGEAKARAEAEAATRVSATKTAFISNMSHELRTPLNAILGYAELLTMRADAVTPDRMRADLDNILQAGHHLLDLINDILDMAKIESGQAELDPSTFTPRDLFDETLSLVAPLLDRQGNTVTVTGLALDRLVTADRLKLRQCLVNLVGNAAKFTKNGTISLSAATTPTGDINLSVADTGIGLSDEQIATLFTAFRQGDKHTAAEYGGTGLGLAITRSHCELMGGAISVTSTPGRGTRFTMALPILTPEVDLDHPDGADPSPIDVVVVEDDRSYGDLLARVIQQAGHRVTVARTGERALALLLATPPRMLVTDLVLPSMDGFELIRRVRASDHPPHRVLALTSLDLTREQREELELEGVDILLKRETSIARARERILALLTGESPPHASALSKATGKR